MKTRIALILGLSGCVTACCVATEAAAQPPAATSQVSGKPAPVASIPKHVKAPDGKLSLYADYDNARGNHVVLYVVNRTKKAIQLPAQDGDIYAKLEVRTKDGRWKRAQGHVYSWCGNSYFPVAVGPGKFIRVSGWKPKAGQMRQVRYRLHGGVELTSNSGKGLVEPAEIKRAETDMMSIRTGDAALLKRVLFKTPGASPDDQRTAIHRLAEFPRKTSLPILEKVLKSPAFDDQQIELAVGAVGKIAPERLQSYVKDVFRKGPAKRRLLFLRQWYLIPKSADKEIQAILLKQLTTMEAGTLRYAMARLASRRLPVMKKHLAEIQHAEKYPKTLRIAARYEREQWFGDHKVDLKIDQVSRYWKPSGELPLLISITNRTAKALTFRYRNPSDVVSLYLKVRGEFVAPKPGVTWFDAGTNGEITSVTLKPRQTHQLRVNLLDYFDPAFGNDRELTAFRVWVSCSIPGAHTVPQLDRGGTRISIKR